MMKVSMSRELKSPRQETATIQIEWNPQDQLQDNAAAIIAAVVDMAEQYIEMANKLNPAPTEKAGLEVVND